MLLHCILIEIPEIVKNQKRQSTDAGFSNRQRRRSCQQLATRRTCHIDSLNLHQVLAAQASACTCFFSGGTDSCSPAGHQA